MNSSPYPIRKDWTSDVQLHTGELLCPPMSSTHPQRNENFYSCTNVGAMSSRASQTGEDSHPNRTNHRSSSDRFRDNLWTKELTETINNISRECLDRLTKLENENKELRKQYRVLEAQIQPLVKSLHVHEPVCMHSQHPENGKTFIYGTDRTGQNFDSQIRQLISVLVHTNIAQNDIREDCRYLKHRISNLEIENSKLSSMVRDHYPHIENQQSHYPEMCNCSLRSRFASLIDPDEQHEANYTDDRSTVDNSMASHLESCLVRPASFYERAHGFSTNQAHSAAQSTALVKLGYPIMSHGQRRHSAQLLDPVKHVDPFWFGDKFQPVKTDRQFFEAYVRPAIEGSLLRASSTPAIPITDQASAKYNFFPTESDTNTVLAVSQTNQSSEYLLDSHQSEQRKSSLTACNRHGPPIIRDMPLTPSPLRSVSCETPHSVHDRNNSSFIPHGWLQLPVLPKTGLKRNPVGTRSHIILGARSIPLYLNASAEELSTKSQLSGEVDHSYAGLSTSPLARRQTRAYSTHLRPIEEVDSNLQSVYEMVTSNSRNCVSKTNSTSSRNGTVQDNLLHSMSGDMSPLENIRRILYRDPKTRYLHPLKATQKTKPTSRPMSVKTTSRQSSDLETLLYHQDQLHKCREAQRTLRYGVFSDTELLTGKFTITSRDDSAIESGEDEDDDVQSSRESMRLLQVNETIVVGNHYQSTRPENEIEQAVKKDEIAGIVHNCGRSNGATVQMQCCDEQPSGHDAKLCSDVVANTQLVTDEESEAVDTIHHKIPESTVSQQCKIDSASRSTMAPPPVVIHRRRFGFPNSTENISTIPGDELHGLNSVEENTVSPNPAGQSSPDHQSSDTDSLVFSSISPGSEVESSDQSRNNNNPESRSKLPLTRGNISGGSDETLANRSLKTHQHDTRLLGSSEVSGVQLITFSVPSSSDVTCGGKTACENHKRIFGEQRTDEAHENEKTSEGQMKTGFMQESNDSHKLNGSYSSISQNTYSKINKLLPNYVNSRKYQTGTPHQAKQTKECEAYNFSNIERVRNSGYQKPSFIPGIPEAKCSRSFPNSPEQGSNASSKYRVHVTSSVVKFGTPKSSQLKGDSTSIYANPKSMTVETCRKPVQKYVTTYSPETKSRSRCLPSDRVSTYGSSQSPKGIISPPPIPPRTSSRTHSIQTKSTSALKSTQNDYRALPNNLHSPVKRMTQRHDRSPQLTEITRYTEQKKCSQSPSPVTTPKSFLRANQPGRAGPRKVRIIDDPCKETGVQDAIPGSPGSSFGYSPLLATGFTDRSQTELAHRIALTRGNYFTTEPRKSCDAGESFNGFDSRVRGVLRTEIYDAANGRLPHSPQPELYHKNSYCSISPRNQPPTYSRHKAPISPWKLDEEITEQYSPADSYFPQNDCVGFQSTNIGRVSYHNTKPFFNAEAYSHENNR